MKRKRLKERVQAIYDQIPRIECQGKCWDYCGPILMSGLEMKRLVDAGGRAGAMFSADDLLCGALDRRSHRCTRYAVRPLVCRLFGVVEDLRCPHGCRPERVLSRSEAVSLQAQVTALSAELGYDEGCAGTRLDMQDEGDLQTAAQFVALDQVRLMERGRLR